MARDPSPDDLPAPAAVARLTASSYPPGVPASYPYPAVALTRLLDDAAADFPDTPAVEAGAGRLSYAGLLDATDRLAAALCDLGVQPGQRVGVALPDSPAHLALLFAALRVGAVVCEHDPAAAPATLASQVTDAGCRVLALAAPAVASVPAPPGVEHVISVGAGDLLPAGRLRTVARSLRPGWRRPRRRDDRALRLATLAGATAAAVTQARVDLTSAPAVVVYPSAGEPRGAVLTHANLVAAAFQVRLWVPDVLAGREKLLAGWPLHTAVGLTAALGLGVLSAATVTVLSRPLTPRSRSDPLWAALARRRPTLVVVPPPAAGRLAAGPSRRRWDATSARVVLCGPGAVRADVLRGVEAQTGARVRRVHGLPEAPLTHANPVYGRAKAGSVGLPLPDTASVVVDARDPGRVLPAGVPGRLAVSGPQVFAGWWGRPMDTAEAFAGPWLLTSTVATVDADGYVRVADGPAGGGATAAAGP